MLRNGVPSGSDDTASSELIGPLTSWRRQLTAQRMSPATLDRYSLVGPRSRPFLASARLTQLPLERRRQGIETFLTEIVTKFARRRYRWGGPSRRPALRCLVRSNGNGTRDIDARAG